MSREQSHIPNDKTHEKTRNRRGLRFLRMGGVALLLLLLLPSVAQAAVGQPVLYRHHIVMIQGDDPGTMETEPENQILVIERFGYLVPWDNDTVDSPVPKGSHTMSIDQVAWSDSIGYYPGVYSTFMNPENPPSKEFFDMTDMDCCIAHSYVWGFPQGADRNFSFSALLEVDTDFIQYYDDIKSDKVWNFSSSGLSLEPGNESGEYVSTINVADSVNITTFELSWYNNSHGDNISIFISNNNGTLWHDVTGNEGRVTNFTSTGSELLWRINMTQDVALNNTPVLSDLWFNLTYVPWYSDIIIQLTYILERDPDTDSFEFVMDLYDDYIYGVNPHFVMYINKDHTLESEAVPFTLFETQTEYPEKDAFVFMTGTYDYEAPISIRKNQEEETSYPIQLFLIILLVIIIMLIVLVMVMSRTEIPDYDPDEDGEAGGADSRELEELEAKKASLLMAIKKLDSDHEEGLVDDDVHSEMRAGYKARAVELTRQIDALAAAAAQPEVPEVSEEEEALLAKKQKLLKGIKKLDTDFEEGLLDEDVYQELRAGYKEKAVKAARELDELRSE